MSRRNPYVAGRVVAGSEFFGRSSLINRVVDLLDTPQAVQVVIDGPRRIGKSSILRAIAGRLALDRFAPVAVDLLPVKGRPLADLLLRVAERVTEYLDLPSPDPGRFDARGVFFRREFLTDVATALAGSRRLVLLIDELDAVESADSDVDGGIDLFGYLADLGSSTRAPSWVGVVGADPRDRPESLKALLRSAESNRVWVFDSDEAELVARQGESDAVLLFDDGVVERILALCGRHPWAVQLLCRAIFEAAERRTTSEPHVIGLEDVDAAIPTALREGGNNFEWWWQGLTPGEMVACATCARLDRDGTGVTWSAIDREARTVAPRFGASGVLPDPSRLEERHLFEAAGEDRVQFAVELFARWIRSNRTIREAGEALDDRDVSARRAFTEARAAFGRRDWTLAVDLCRRALSAFPEHFNARLLYGQALIESGQPGVAIPPLREAYARDPEAARVSLVRALVAEAHARLADPDPFVRASAATPIDEARRIDPEDPALRSLPPIAAAEPTAVTDVVPVYAPPQASDDHERTARTAAVRERIVPLFTGEEPPCGRYSEVMDGGQEWVAGLLYCFNLETVDHRPVSLQVFESLHGLGGVLWERAAHALVQLSARRHSAIPRVLDGGYHEESDGSGFAYIVTDAAGDTLADEPGMAALRSDRQQSLLHFYRLAEALTLLHERGIVHRNLWPGAIERKADPVERDADVLRLARFEMSILISNLLRGVTRAEPERNAVPAGADDPARAYYVGQGKNCLACCPPERLRNLFSEDGSWKASPAGNLEDHRADVYGLGMVAAQWFVGPEAVEQLGTALVGLAPNWATFQSAHREVGAAIERSALPSEMKKLLRSMIELDPRSRPSSDQVRLTLQENYNGLLEVWNPHRTTLAHLVGVITEQTVRELAIKGWLDSSSSSEVVSVELCEKMELDLRGGKLTYSERGFSPYVRSPTTSTDTARYVLMGKDFAWFAVQFEPKRARPGAILPQVLLAKYVIERNIFRPANDASYRDLPKVQVYPWDSPRLHPDRVQDRPTWTNLLEAVALRGGLRPWHQQVLDALSWLLRYQRVQLDARLYPYTLASDSTRGDTFVLEYDRDRDRDYLNQDPLLSLFARVENRRPSFLDFCDGDMQDDATAALLVRLDRNGRPDLTVRGQVEVLYRGHAGGNAIQVRRGQTGGELPARGWLQPRGDFASALQIRNQERALLEAVASGGLLDQLREPRSLRRPWREELPTSELRGGAASLVEAMITARPFYALHGPPGTGKTTVASRAVEGMLHADRSARILVAAQSHFALDNLAERLLERTKTLRGVTAVRIASPEGADKVSPKLQRYFPARRAAEQVKHVQDGVQGRLDRATDGPELIDLLRRWQAQVPKSQIEIQERLERGANLVFVTCGTATDGRLGTDSSSGGFDRVIVEEAAKAWPTELLMPLVRGREWVLIGDHLQLPAYKRDEAIQLLQECGEAADERLRQAGKDWERYVEVFDVFKNLFERSHNAPSGAMARLVQDPLGSLTMQFRMRKPIGELVSRAFYKGKLATDPNAGADRHPGRREHLSRPSWHDGHELVWVDTGPFGQEAPCWRNDVEARAVAQIAADFGVKRVTKNLADEFVMLAPYRDQVARIQEHLKRRNLDDLASHVNTVDSFQGREADVAVVSLVRFNQHDPEKRPRTRLGHMAAPERLNVMVSRARQTLVLVGSFDFFAESKIEHWDRICEVVDELGVRVPIRHVLSDVGGGL